MRDDPVMCKLLPSGNVLRIYQDPFPESPRRWDNMGELYVWAGRASSPDDLDGRSLAGILREFIETERNADGDVIDLEEDEKALIEKANQSGKVLVLPLELDRSSGRLFHCAPHLYGEGTGIHMIRKDKALREWGGDQAWIDLARKRMEGELANWNQYVTGDIFGFLITDPSTGDTLDSCWGFYGPVNKSGMHEHFYGNDALKTGMEITELPDADACKVCGRVYTERKTATA